MARPWLAHYPQGVPQEISTEGYASLVDLLDRACQRHAARTACTAMGTDISYAQLDAYARAFAAWLQSLNLPKGSRVALMMPNVPAYLVSMLARCGPAISSSTSIRCTRPKSCSASCWTAAPRSS